MAPVLEALRRAARPLSLAEVVAALGPVAGADAEAQLRALVQRGEAVQNRRGQYCLREQIPGLVVGTVQAQRSGDGWLHPDDGSASLYLASQQMREVMHGDRVAARIDGGRYRGKPQGSIVEVLERRTREVVGRLTVEAGVAWLTPDNPRITHRVLVPVADLGPAEAGQIVIVELTRQPGRNAQPMGRVSRVLGDHGAPGMETDIAIHSHGLPSEFPEAVLAEAHAYGVAIPADAIAGREVWDGKRAGTDGATRDYGADDAFPIGDIDDILPGLIEQCSRVYYTMGVHPEFDQQVIGWVNTLRAQAKHGKHTPHEFVALDHLLHDMRLYKSRAEVAMMRRAAQISVGAHIRAMKSTKPGINECEVMADIVHEFNRHGADTSYHPIVGGGANACTLHYSANNQELRDGDLLLIDAGCEYRYYAADITRTFPVNGRFSPEQKAIYDVVLEAQEAALAAIRPGNHYNEFHEAAVKATTQGLVRLGLLKGRVPTLIKEEAYKKFFMHKSGHWLGLDVHDVGD